MLYTGLRRIILGLIIMWCLSGCKKGKKQCASTWSAVIEQTAVNATCAYVVPDDSSSYLNFGFRPNLTASHTYQLIMRFKNEPGTQYLDSTDSYRLIEIYDSHSEPPKIYSLYGAAARASITVTDVDSIGQKTIGQFNATLTAQHSPGDSIRVTDGRFSITWP